MAPKTETPCPMCRGLRKVYPEHARGGMVALDTVPGYDPRIPCPVCVPKRDAS